MYTMRQLTICQNKMHLKETSCPLIHYIAMVITIFTIYCNTFITIDTKNKNILPYNNRIYVNIFKNKIITKQKIKRPISLHNNIHI